VTPTPNPKNPSTVLKNPISAPQLSKNGHSQERKRKQARSGTRTKLFFPQALESHEATRTKKQRNANGGSGKTGVGEQRGRLDGGGHSGNSLDGINGSSGREGGGPLSS
jgi:hypothetical protein